MFLLYRPYSLPVTMSYETKEAYSKYCTQMDRATGMWWGLFGRHSKVTYIVKFLQELTVFPAKQTHGLGIASAMRY